MLRSVETDVLSPYITVLTMSRIVKHTIRVYEHSTL